MATVEEDDEIAKARRKELQDALAATKIFTDLNRKGAPVGMAYAIDGKVREIRTFAHPGIYALHSETLLNTVALEGELAQRTALREGRAIFVRQAQSLQVRELVQNALKLKEEVTETEAGNSNTYQKDQKVWKGKCKLKDEEITEVWQAAE